MNKIVRKAIKYFEFQENLTDTKILDYCKKLDLYQSDIDNTKLLLQIRKGLQNSSKDVLRRLDFHFARQTNKLLFDIYQIILTAPNGLKYKDIGNILNDQKTNNIAISHYCRKLFKANFISVSYVKEGTLVTAIKYKSKKQEIKQDQKEQIQQGGQKRQKDQQLKLHLKDGFLIKQLSIDNNILLNMSGMESFINNGLTKEQISANIFKTSEKKTISRLIQNFKFERDGERKGRIYGFRFKGDLNKVKKFVNKNIKVPTKTSPVILQEEVEEFLRERNPDIDSPNLLQYLINNCPRDSKSTKQTRQCDPIKLSRVIYLLNYINNKPSTIQNMSAHIVNQDKINNAVNVGIMHKTSLTRILQTLLALNLITLQQNVIYPTWKELEKLQNVQIIKKQPERNIKQIKQQKSLRKKKEVLYSKIMSEKEAYQQITTQKIYQNIRSSWLGMLRLGFREIKKIGFRKQQPQIPRPHILRILDQSPHKIQSLNNPTSLQNLFEQIDSRISDFMIVEQEIKYLDVQTKKYLRTYPQKKVSDFIKRFGRNSQDTLKQMVENKIMQIQGKQPNQVYSICSPNTYFI